MHLYFKIFWGSISPDRRNDLANASLAPPLTTAMNIDYISTKISKGIGIIARLRHLVPFTILLNIYPSLIEPYIPYYGLVAWGQAANTYQNKFVILQSGFFA